LIQAGAPSGYHGRYRLSYLMPLLIWQGSAILVAPEALQQRLLMVEIPRLHQWMPTHKAIRMGDRWPDPNFQGLLLTSPQHWLSDRLFQKNLFPPHIPTLLDGVDDLEEWASDQLTTHLDTRDWEALMLAYPEQAEAIRDTRVRLTRSLFQHPANPYECYLIDRAEQELLQQLIHDLQATDESDSWLALPENWQTFAQGLQQDGQLIWTEISRDQGQFSLHCGPADVSAALQQVWPQQPVVLIGGALDLEPEAPIYRQRLGLGDLTCVKFSPDRQTELIQLYLPDRLPMPNTPQFQGALMQELQHLLQASSVGQRLTVVIVGDVPLKAQVGSMLAGEFGSRVQVERTCLDDRGILVTGWEFWREHQAVLPAPHLLVIATLPIPSLEDPLVAGRVAYYKQRRQDWFRLYLLPEALSELQRAIAPVRESQGVVALLDNRVNHRTYGKQVLAALSPLARISYVDANLFTHLDYSMLD
jgi:ATP-dependent DNA helicase DinG